MTFTRSGCGTTARDMGVRSVDAQHQRPCIGSTPSKSFSRNYMLEQRVRGAPSNPSISPFFTSLPLQGSIVDCNSLNSRLTHQDHPRPPTRPPSFSLDVHPLPNGRLPDLPLYPLRPSLRPNPLGHLSDRFSHLPLRSVHHYRFHHRHSHVHHI